MIHWTRLLLVTAILTAGFVVGSVAHLPYDQASNLVFFLVGLAVGIAGIVASFWIADRDRQARMNEILGAITDTRESVKTLAAIAEASWKPALDMLSKTQTASVESLIELAQRQTPR